MRRNSKMIRRIFVASILLGAVALAQPQPGNHQGPGPQGNFERGPKPGAELHSILPPGRWWKDAEVVKDIGLNDGQVQKIEHIFQDSRMKLVDVHANLQKEEFKLEPLLEAENPDEGAVLAAIDRITTAHANLEKANAQMAFAIRRVLTPEQWKKLRALHPHHDHFPAPGPAFEGRHGDMQHGHPPAPPEPNAPGAPGAPPAPENAPEPSK
jgi:Spy/CpxP family protein refolding chaperone